tara:strand:+ start:1116 stop:1403 length:288 start_codon:yes stop_codon:yes gene_type:complete
LLHASATLKGEGLGHDSHSQAAVLLCKLSHYRSSAGTCTTAHASGDKYHVNTLNKFLDLYALVDGREAANFRNSTGTEPTGLRFAELDGGVGERR